MISHNSQEPVVRDTVYLMEKEFSFDVTKDGETHNLVFSLFYDEDKSEVRELVRFKCDRTIIQTGPEFEDLGAEIQTAITDWFFGAFTDIDSEDEKKSKEIDEIFEIIWDFINENGLA